MNYQVDIMISGDSKSGHEILDKLASGSPTIKFAFISQSFKSTTTHDYLNVEYFKDEVIFTDYKNRLFGCYLKNGDRIYGTHLIIASGLTYSPFTINNKPVLNVYHTTDDIPKTAKNLPAVVIGNKNSDIKFALDVAKKYKQVYLCVKDMSFDNIASANNKKLEKVKNLLILPNTSILKAISKDGALQKVELDNYSTLSCSAIYVKTDATPATAFVSDRLVKKDEAGYLLTNDKAESTLVPKCFAIGNCAKKYTKAIKQLLIETILNDF
jgi:thioredoxin reductase